MNPYENQPGMSEVRSTDNLAERSWLGNTDAVTATFAIVMFGLAIPVNAYIMLKYAVAFGFREPSLVNAVKWAFPWLPLLFAVLIPALAILRRKKLSGRGGVIASLILLASTLIVGIVAFAIVSMPIVTWLNSI